MKPQRLLLACILLASFVYCFFSSSLVEATSSTCRGPSSTSSSAKRGASVLSQTEIEDIVESELLSLHAQGLDAEDFEYLSQLTTEQINSLGFGRRLRRLGRRIGRALRRVVRVIGRIAGGLLRGIFRLFRSRSRAIIENSVAKFNGFTGPNHETLETRRPFIGGGSQGGAAVASASVLRRRGRRFGFRRVFRAVRRFGRRAARVARRIGGAARAVKRFGRGAARAFKRFGRSALKQINEQSIKRGGKIGRFFSSVSKHFAKRSMRQKMESLENQSAGATDGKPVNCVACRVDCMKEYSTIGGSMFSSCGQRYYYYGCQAVKPCFQTKTASDDEIEGMVGICAFRNGCKFENQWKLVGENQILTDRLVGRIRGSGQDPE